MDKISLTTASVLAFISIAAGGSTQTAAGQEAATETATHTISVMAVEYKMRRKVSETPYPNTLEEHPDLEDAAGYKLIPPDTEVEGEWGLDAYQFVPGTIVVTEGDDVLLRFFGVNGDSHPTTIDGYDQSFEVRRGELTEVQFVADKAGTFTITCHAHPPTMVAHLIVLPRSASE